MYLLSIVPHTCRKEVHILADGMKQQSFKTDQQAEKRKRETWVFPLQSAITVHSSWATILFSNATVFLLRSIVGLAVYLRPDIFPFLTFWFCCVLLLIPNFSVGFNWVENAFSRWSHQLECSFLSNALDTERVNSIQRAELVWSDVTRSEGPRRNWYLYKKEGWKENSLLFHFSHDEVEV